MRPPARPAWAAVSDFDGTITTFDVGDALLLHCGRADKAMIAASYAPGVKVETFMAEAFAGAPLTEEQIADFVLRRVRARRGFAGFAARCAALGVPFEVVSGGIDLYSDPFFSRFGLAPKVFIGRGRADGAGVRLVYPFLKGTDLVQFKAARVRAHRRAGRRVLFCGDGPSDFEAAKAADKVYAAARLLKLCRAQGVAASPLTDFSRAAAFLGREAGR